MVGNRDVNAAFDFMSDLKSRLASRVQLTTDALSAYVEAVGETFGSDIGLGSAHQNLRRSA